MPRIIKDGLIYTGGTANVVHKYSATLTSSQYGWFTFVDEDGNDLSSENGIPIVACSVTSQQYYVGQFIIIAGKWQFKVAEINNSNNPTIGTQLSDITFTMAYIEYSS